MSEYGTLRGRKYQDVEMRSWVGAAWEYHLLRGTPSFPSPPHTPWQSRTHPWPWNTFGFTRQTLTEPFPRPRLQYRSDTITLVVGKLEMLDRIFFAVMDEWKRTLRIDILLKINYEMIADWFVIHWFMVLLFQSELQMFKGYFQGQIIDWSYLKQFICVENCLIYNIHSKSKRKYDFLHFPISSSPRKTSTELCVERLSCAPSPLSRRAQLCSQE